MAPRHCCCGPTSCKICDDNFNRANENPVTGQWDEISGDWGITSNQLKSVTEGPLITTCQQIAPKDNSVYTYEFRFKIDGSAPWKIICKYTSSTTFDWVLIESVTVGGSTGLQPKFYRRVSSVDTVVFDPENDYPDDQSFIDDPAVAGSPVDVQICYAEEEWSLLSGQVFWDAECGDPAPAAAFPDATHGFVGFLSGQFDDFEYFVHWESDHDCLACTCICYEDTDTYSCLPETLCLTLTPIASDPDCPGSTTHSYDLIQANPDEPVDPATVTQYPRPAKVFWYSDPFEVVCDEDLYGWWRLECIARGEYELTLLDYPSGSRTAPSTFPATIFQFITQDGDTGGSMAGPATAAAETSVQCDPAIIRFGNVEKFQLTVGSGSPPVYNCCPFDELRYSTIVTEGVCSSGAEASVWGEVFDSGDVFVDVFDEAFGDVFEAEDVWGETFGAEPIVL